MKGEYLDRSPQRLPPNVDDLLLQLSNPQSRSSPSPSPRASLASPRTSLTPRTSPITPTTTSRTSISRGSRMTAGGVPPSYSSLTSSTTPSSSSPSTTMASYSRSSGDRRRESGGLGGRVAVRSARGGASSTAAAQVERGLTRDLDRCRIRTTTTTTSRSVANLYPSSSSYYSSFSSSTSSSSKPFPSFSIKTSTSSPSALSSSSTLTDSSTTKTSTTTARRGNRLYRTRQEARKAREEERSSSARADTEIPRKGRSLDVEDPSLSISDSNSLLSSRDLPSKESDLSKTSTTSSLYSDQDLDPHHHHHHDPHFLNNNDKGDNNARTRRIIQKSATTPVLASCPQRASFDYESTTPEEVSDSEKDKKGKKAKEGAEEKEKEGGGWRKKRFGKKILAKTLRRSQSASCARDVPAHALFLKHHLGEKGVESLEDRLSKGAAYSSDGTGNAGETDTRRSSLPRSIHKTSSADATMMSRDEFGNITCQNKTNRKSLAKTMKRKLQFLRRRHTDSTLASMTKGDGKHSANVDPEEALQWSRSFESLLMDKKGLELFRGFLRSEFSEENLEFWMAVEEFKLVKPRKVTSLAHKIYTNFVEEQAPREINVDSETRMRTLAKLNAPSKSVFEEAQRKVQALMEKDSYPRFLESDAYQRIVNSSKC